MYYKKTKTPPRLIKNIFHVAILFVVFIISLLAVNYVSSVRVFAAARCYEAVPNSQVTDCSNYEANFFPGGQMPTEGCYVIETDIQEVSCGRSPFFNTGAPEANGDECGAPGDAVKVSINVGCRGQGNPIVDMLFAFIRFLSAGVGIVVIGSIVVAGIQYTTSQGDPNATAKALGRINSSGIALLIYIFAAALLNFIIPAGIFK